MDRPSRRPASPISRVLCLACLASAALAAQASPRLHMEAREYREARNPERIPDHIADRLEALEAGGESVLAGEKVAFRKDMAGFYRRRDHRPAWIVFGRHALPEAWQLLDAVWKSDQEGLDPADYHAVPIDSLLGRFGRRFGWGTGPGPEAAALLDILLTDAYLKLAGHLLTGRVHPISPADRWHIAEEDADLAAYLDSTLAHGGKVRESLRNLAPRNRDYGVMKYWLSRYRDIEEGGGWTAIPPGPALGPGDRGQRVAFLCRRLAAEYGLYRGTCGEIYDRDLASAVRRFQGRLGLARSGRADEATLRQLNVPVRERLEQIRLSLECWRWLPRDLGDRHIRVDIADFSLTAWEEGRPALSLKVVVGRKQDSTPVFSDRIVGVALNPPWHVPESIAEEEILPELRKDPAYLESRGMELLTSWSSRGEPVSPDTVDWHAIQPGQFRFRIRQRSGDGSALGKLKFAMTNPFNIYLHDTPSKAYFARHRRALSHGCVRVERPLELAEWLLRPDWDRRAIAAEISKGGAATLPVAGEGVPVHILYWTAFADAEGGLQFRRDIYGWVRRMEADLKEKTAGL